MDRDKANTEKKWKRKIQIAETNSLSGSATHTHSIYFCFFFVHLLSRLDALIQHSIFIFGFHSFRFASFFAFM